MNRHTTWLRGLVWVLAVGTLTWLFAQAQGGDSRNQHALLETLVAIDASTARVVHRTAFGRPVSCLAVSKDGTRIYVGDFDGNVEALDATTVALRAAS